MLAAQGGDRSLLGGVVHVGDVNGGWEGGLAVLADEHGHVEIILEQGVQD